ncbi:HlyD family efflux transporter periplasmic adaptor subunit, partial [Vibrio anguillarum]
PESGVITAIQPIEGSKVDVNTPLLSILPIDSPLEIELLLPTRSAGFIEIGNKVNVRFDAFPYQKFGFITGVISNIDKVVVLPSEKVLPIQLDEAMYRV